MPDKIFLKQMQQLPLIVKIRKTQLRIKEWYDHFDGNVYVSFSGGKDSMSKQEMLEQALLWVIHEQCEYAGKVYARLLIHGTEAFAALGLQDGCEIKEIEERLFKGV